LRRTSGGCTRELVQNSGRRTRASLGAEGAVVAMGAVIGGWGWFADVAWFERHLHSYRCLHDEHALHVVSTWRWGAAICAALLVVVVRPMVGRLVARHGLPSFGALARCGVAVIMSLVVTEVYLRKPWKTPPPPGECSFCPPVTTSDGYRWFLVPSTEHRWNPGGREVVYAVDAEGNRAPSVGFVADHERPTILVAGESIALGMGVRYEETFSALLEARLGVQVVDLGVHGFGLDQAYLRAEEEIALYARPLALVMLFVPEQATRSEAEDRGRLRAGPGGELVRVPAAPAWIREIRLRSLLLHALPSHGDAEVEDMRAVVRATVALAKKRGVMPYFLATNFDQACMKLDGKEAWIYRTLFTDQGVAHAVVDLPLDLRVAPEEPHPGAEAHRRLADAVERALRDAHVVGASASRAE